MYDSAIAHVSYSSSLKSWFSVLFDAVSGKCKQVLVPQLPTIKQNYKNWSKAFNTYNQFIDENTSFIAHHSSSAFVIVYIGVFRNTLCLFSDNAFYTPISMSIRSVEQLSTKMAIIPSGKHLNAIQNLMNLMN